ncbi:TPR domain protein [Syntrophotalea carbinolica DSM 2380]|uniref:TPR domain protein n=1 Tax=Syntrophotalea carbinolica (strain DSM 2380 / NBRC 103641 / GraBd1) TaxID=338963 RepID=Q3A1G3_SYNC1|nr:tetratricopeptide repeat protein [Syntrophotalea carbinolica]ABA89794.1 TPR domain protein [Syntrophotalea carbinolica DSM 2380]
MTKIVFLWACLAVMLLFAGCTGLQQEPPSAAPSSNTAVAALLNKARVQSAGGRLPEASVLLERALRIEARNPLLWQELARVRLAQGQYRQAENLAAKSNTLAAGDAALRAQNWRIIGEARTRLGDLQGARAAFSNAE